MTSRGSTTCHTRMIRLVGLAVMAEVEDLCEVLGGTEWARGSGCHFVDLRIENSRL